MKKQKRIKLLSLVIAIVMIISSLPMSVFAVDIEAVNEGSATTSVDGLKDYSMPSNEKHAYDPFAQLESEEATKAYRESVQYVAGSIIYKVSETKGWFGGYKDEADRDSLTSFGIDLSSAEELSRKRVDNGFFTDTYEVIYEAKLTGDVWEAIDALATTEGVIAAQPNYLYEDTAVDVPTIEKNPDKDKQWHHGPDHLECDKHWQHMHDNGITAGEGAIVAVIDTGVDYTHNDLAANMWVNTAELNGVAGADDDGNGYVDDIYGVSTVGAKQYHSGDPMDDHGHGTHVAGIIAMTANNGEGGVGMAYGAKIMAIKAGQATGIFSDTDIAEAINYAVAMGADVINMSFGGTGKSFLVEEALANAFGSCVLVAAAGNDGLPTTDAPDDFMKKADFYPAGYSYVLGVMASDQDGNLASFSNWDYYNNGGSAEYEITAPGVDIYSTLPGNQYASWDGTSMAAPVVSAAAALIRSQYPDRELYSSRFIMGQLASATEDMTNYADKIGVVHSYGALNLDDSLNKLPKPNLTVKNTYLFDDPAIAPENDGDGIIDAGETIDLGIVLRNQWGMASDVTVKVDAISDGGVANPNIEWISDTITMENIGTFNEQNNSFVYENDMLVGTDNPIRFKVKSDTINDAHIGFNITITCSNALDAEDSAVYTFDPKLGFDMTFFVQRGRSLSGRITENMTLTEDDYWIVDGIVLIPEGVTVTISEGTQVQFYGADRAASIYIQADGVLNIEGTESNPVEIFPVDSSSLPIDIRNADSVSYTKIINPDVSLDVGDHIYAVNNFKYDFTSFGNKPTNSVHANKISNSIFSHLYIGYNEIRGDINCSLFERIGMVDTNKLANFNVSQSTFIGGLPFPKPNSYTSINAPEITSSNSLVYWYPKTIINTDQIYEFEGKKYFVPGFDYYDITRLENLGLSAEIIRAIYAEMANQLNGSFASINTEEEEIFVFDVAKSIGKQLYLGGHVAPKTSQVIWWDNSTDYNISIENPYDMNGYVICLTHGKYFLGTTEPSYDFLIEIPDYVTTDEILSVFTFEKFVSLMFEKIANTSAQYPGFALNAILNNYALSNEHWVKLTTDSEGGAGAVTDYNALALGMKNYWGTENVELIKKINIDADSDPTLPDLLTDPILTLESPELENIYPFVTEIYLTDTEGNRITTASYGQELTVHVKFNRDMDVSVQPMVSYGPAEPYTDYVLNGDFVSAREWCADFKALGVIDAGMEYFRVKDAVAADDAWLKTGTDAARFAFEVSRTGAEALTMQAVGGENKVELSWTQDDYQTLAGFNVYRSETADGTFKKLNTRLIPGTIREYVDTDVEPGKEYFYYFTVMGTDLVESIPSNTASATAIDNVKPNVVHSRVTYGNSGEALAFNVTATDNIGIDYVKIFYRTQGTATWSVLSLSETEAGKYYGVITANNVTAAGLEYYLEVSDGTSVVRDGSSSAPVKITVDNSLAIYSVSPHKVDTTAVSGGILATMTGVNFTDTMTLKIGGKVTEYTYVSSTQITFTVPAGNLGRCDAQLIDGDRSARLTNAITYTDLNSEAQITAPDEVKAREEIKLPIKVTANGDVISLDIRMKLTKSLYSSVKFEKASTLGSAYVQFNCNYSGVAKLVISATSAMDLSQPIGYLVLTPANTAEPISTSVEMTSVLANAIEVETLVDCNFEIRPNFTLSGKITYYAGGAGIEGVKVTLNNGMVAYTDENGVYTFTGITTNHVVITTSMSGSVNDAVSATDASEILVDLVEDTSSFSEMQFIAADVDGDGIITAHDAAYILQKSVGIIEGDFPGSGAEWAFVGTNVLNLTADKSDANFTGILLGDVTGDWTATSNEMD